MNTKLKKLFAVAVAMLSAFCVLFNVACSGQHEHTYSEKWTYNARQHWRTATCEHDYLTKDRAAHSFGSDGKCVVCGYNQPNGDSETPEHEHTFAKFWSKDELFHWHYATCGDTTEVSGKELHEFGDDHACLTCGYYHEHIYSEDWTGGPDSHWHKATCAHDYEVADGEPHIDENHDDICDKCKYKMAHQHYYSDEWSFDGNKHWRNALCGHLPTDVSSHINANLDGQCDVCGLMFADYYITWGNNTGEVLEDEIHLRLNEESTSFYIGDLEEGLYLVSISVSSRCASGAYYVHTISAKSRTYFYGGDAVVEITEGVDRIYLTTTYSSAFGPQYAELDGLTIEKYVMPTLTANDSIKLPVTATYFESPYWESRKGNELEIKIPLDPNLSGEYTLKITAGGYGNGGRLTVTIGESQYDYKQKSYAPPYLYSGLTVTIGEGDTTISIKNSTGLFDYLVWVELIPVTE